MSNEEKLVGGEKVNDSQLPKEIQEALDEFIEAAASEKNVETLKKIQTKNQAEVNGWKIAIECKCISDIEFAFILKFSDQTASPIPCFYYPEYNLFLLTYFTGVNKENDKEINNINSIHTKLGTGGSASFDKSGLQVVNFYFKDFKKRVAVANKEIKEIIYWHVLNIYEWYCEFFKHSTNEKLMKEWVINEAPPRISRWLDMYNMYQWSVSDVYKWIESGSDHERLGLEFTNRENIELKLDKRTKRRYHLSLQARKFVILAGVSGTGKTQLAIQYAEAIGAEKCIVAVAPNWTSNEDLLGYYNPMTDDFVPTEVTEFLKKAHDEPARPYHLILDEMNLARVEHYFASFLSAMELREPGKSPKLLDFGPDNKPLFLPENLYFIGTVNIDETTHGFADKVFDRAQLIEIPVDYKQLKEHADARLCNSVADMLMDIWSLFVKEHNLEAPFAFRVLDDIAAYFFASFGVKKEAMDKNWENGRRKELEEFLDEMIVQKILPRIRGNDTSLGGEFWANLIKLVEKGITIKPSNVNGDVENDLTKLKEILNQETEQKPGENFQLPQPGENFQLSLSKIKEMENRCSHYSYTSFFK